MPLVNPGTGGQIGELNPGIGTLYPGDNIVLPDDIKQVAYSSNVVTDMDMIKQIWIGGSRVQKLYKGTTEIKFAYIGDDLIFGNQIDETNRITRLYVNTSISGSSYTTSKTSTSATVNITLGSSTTSFSRAFGCGNWVGGSTTASRSITSSVSNMSVTADSSNGAVKVFSLSGIPTYTTYYPPGRWVRSTLAVGDTWVSSTNYSSKLVASLQTTNINPTAKLNIYKIPTQQNVGAIKITANLHNTWVRSDSSKTQVSKHEIAFNFSLPGGLSKNSSTNGEWVIFSFALGSSTSSSWVSSTVTLCNGGKITGEPSLKISINETYSNLKNDDMNYVTRISTQNLPLSNAMSGSTVTGTVLDSTDLYINDGQKILKQELKFDIPESPNTSNASTIVFDIYCTNSGASGSGGDGPVVNPGGGNFDIVAP